MTGIHHAPTRSATTALPSRKTPLEFFMAGSGLILTRRFGRCFRTAVSPAMDLTARRGRRNCVWTPRKGSSGSRRTGRAPSAFVGLPVAKIPFCRPPWMAFRGPGLVGVRRSMCDTGSSSNPPGGTASSTEFDHPITRSTVRNRHQNRLPNRLGHQRILL